jgi:hypothetical protein
MFLSIHGSMYDYFILKIFVEGTMDLDIQSPSTNTIKNI